MAALRQRAVLTGALLFAGAIAATAGTSVTVAPIAGFDPGTALYVGAINAAGTVAVRGTIGGKSGIWTIANGGAPVFVAQSTSCSPAGIDHAGDVVANCQNGPGVGNLAPFLFNGGAKSLILPPNAYSNLAATAISPAGIVAGDFIDSYLNEYVFTYGPAGYVETIVSGGLALDVDDAADILLQKSSISPSGAFSTLSYILRGGQLVPVGPAKMFDVYATNFNSSGTIVGETLRTQHSPITGFVQSPDGSITTFLAPTGTLNDVNGIDDAGDVIGNVIFKHRYVGFVRTAAGVFVTLRPASPGTNTIPVAVADGIAVGTIQPSDQKLPITSFSAGF